MHLAQEEDRLKKLEEAFQNFSPVDATLAFYCLEAMVQRILD